MFKPSLGIKTAEGREGVGREAEVREALERAQRHRELVEQVAAEQPHLALILARRRVVVVLQRRDERHLAEGAPVD